VLPEVIVTTTTAPPKTQVLPTVLTKPSPLPFTGSDTRSMLFLAGLLMVIGGVTVVAAEDRRERRSTN
jgi:hypothetical protein